MSDIGKKKILVVEDEPDIRELVRYNLEQAGFRVVEAEDGETALEMVRSEQPASRSWTSRRATATSAKSKYGSRPTRWAVCSTPRRCQRRIVEAGTPTSSASIAGVYSRQTLRSSGGAA